MELSIAHDLLGQVGKNTLVKVKKVVNLQWKNITENPYKIYVTWENKESVQTAVLENMGIVEEYTVLF